MIIGKQQFLQITNVILKFDALAAVLIMFRSGIVAMKQLRL